MKKHTNPHAAAISRRDLFKLGGASLTSAVGLGGLSALMPSLAQAQSGGGYRALVCVFLYGGNDGMNMVVPRDNTRYTQYRNVRAALAIPQGNLIDCGSNLGLHPALSRLQAAVTDGKLAPLLNVGPLFSPLSKSVYRTVPATDQRIPDNLFSHSDQQTLWEAASTRVFERTGWGGRAASVLGTTNPVISVGGNGRFGLSATGTPLVLPEPGSNFGLDNLGDNYSPVQKRKAAIERMYQGSNSNALLNAYITQQRNAFDVSARLGTLVETRPGSSPNSAIDQAFAPITTGNRVNTPLGRQLYQVATLIAGRTTVQGNRQIFFAQQGGFDTHANQIGDSSLSGEHAGLLKAMGDAMGCFYNAMKALNLSNEVTLFTQSDFGRTFKPNSTSGTDHAWGNNQIVLGGAVKGGVAYGDYPELVLGGDDDVGLAEWEKQGRWIPKQSVDQYAATLLRWMGANEVQLDTVLPNLKNFGTQRNLGFL